MNGLKNCSISFALAACFQLSACSSAFAQTPSISATHKDVAYHSADEAQKLDVYLADSATEKATPAMIYIHGRAGRLI